MASTTRQLASAALRTTTRTTLATAAPRAFRQGGGRRFNSSGPNTPNKPKTSSLAWIAASAALGGAGYYWFSLQREGATAKVFKPTKEDYQAVYDEIARRLDEKDDYDDGSYGPVLLRLAWHASGTYDKETGTGGSNGATMRFAPEGDHGANAGLKHARDFLEPVKGKYTAPRHYFTFPTVSTSGITKALTTASHSQVPLDQLLGPVDPGRRDRDPGDARPQGALPPRPLGQGHGGLHARRPSP